MDVLPDADVEAVEAVDGVFLTQGAAGDETSIQRFVIDPGAEVPEHDHPHEQVGVITEGQSPSSSTARTAWLKPETRM